MQCPRCRHENSPGAKFCEECAAPLARACTNCGAQLSAAAKFCSECAHPAGAAAPNARRFGPPESYTPKHLVEKILTSKGSLEGERKQVTILFADLKGSMELLADRDPDDARMLLDPILEHMMEAVHRYEGTVNQVMGDGVMALFGAPLAHEDHAVRACYAAVRMQETVKRYAESVRRVEGVPLQIRVGINSGEVVVRSIGSDLRMDYSAIGHTTNLAARMEQIAMPGTIVVAPDTLRLVEDHVQVTALGPTTIKGLPNPIEVYELTGVASVRSRFQAAAARGLSRFVGRDPEMEQLRLALERAAEGHGQVAAVVGEPGVGKSRLYWEFIHSHRTHGWLVLESGSVSHGKATSYLPIIDLLIGYFQIETRDEPRRLREKITGKLLGLDEALRPILPALFELFDLPIGDASWRALDATQRRQRILDAVKRLLLRESQVQPLIVVFEDLHWIDSETQAFLNGLVESVPTARLLLLLNYRPEYRHDWGGKTYYHQLQIDPLASASADVLIQSLLGPGADVRALGQVLIQRTGGNPFFIEESVRTLFETGVLSGHRGDYCLARDVAEIQVPPTVQAVLSARIDRLPPADKRLLQCAAVIGKDVPLPLLQAVSDLPQVDLQHGLARLQAAEFLYEKQLFPELEYTFKHALTQETAYASLLQERRRALHARLVPALEEVHADRLEEHVERLGHHALRGGVWNKAADYLYRAGAKAFGRSALREAAAWYEQAKVALSHVTQTEEIGARVVDICFELRNALMQIGDFARAKDHLLEAKARAEALGDRRRLGQALSILANYYMNTGDLDAALDSGNQALTTAESVGDFRLERHGERSPRLDPLHHWRLAGRWTNAHQARGRADRASSD